MPLSAVSVCKMITEFPVLSWITSTFCPFKAASSLSGKLTERTLVAMLEESSGAAVPHQYSLPPSNAIPRVGSGGSGGSSDSKRENHQLIIWAVGKLKKIYMVRTPPD